MDLFEYMSMQRKKEESPLAVRMRPKNLDEVVGQQHIIGKDKLLYRAIKADKISSLIFYGPPGTGKTTLAKVIANTTSANFVQMNATTSGKKDMEQAVSQAKDAFGMYGKKTILFIDEIHRFNKAQQDYLLPFVEDGTVILIGATTENPYFEVNSALLSRSQIFHLEPLAESDIEYPKSEPYKLCTFSRVMKEKGIEDAINAVESVNAHFGRTVYTLDIFGQVDVEYKERFSQLEKSFPDYISYGGAIEANKSVETLKSYFALLFPTYYKGEGFAGTLIDAMSAGVPVIASDWKYNPEFVVSGKTGVIIKNCNAERLAEELINIAAAPEKWNSMRLSALKESEKYKPDIAARPLIDRING